MPTNLPDPHERKEQESHDKMILVFGRDDGQSRRHAINGPRSFGGTSSMAFAMALRYRGGRRYDGFLVPGVGSIPKALESFEANRAAVSAGSLLIGKRHLLWLTEVTLLWASLPSPHAAEGRGSRTAPAPMWLQHPWVKPATGLRWLAALR